MTMREAVFVALALCALAGLGWVFERLGPMASGFILTGVAP
jgi:hypothetical protein